jgi:peptidylprolyl isomerase
MGFEKEILKAGSGSFPTKGKEVTVHCTGYGKNGDLSVKFWSTKDPGQEPFTFKIGLGQVIKGWDEGVMSMVSRTVGCERSLSDIVFQLDAG